MNAGYNDCCVSGFCAGTPPNCFCDNICTARGDCCGDINLICNEGAEGYKCLSMFLQYRVLVTV